MVVLALCSVLNEITNKKEIVVSHGIDTNTLKTIAMPTVSPESIGRYNEKIGEWILN